MIAVRRRLGRLVAPLLMVAFLSQVGQAQSVSCAGMTAISKAASQMSGMMTSHSAHSGSTLPSDSSKNTHHEKKSSVPVCAQGTSCVSVAAIPDPSPNAKPPAMFAFVIPQRSLPLEARSLSPDSPPPKFCPSTDSARR